MTKLDLTNLERFANDEDFLTDVERDFVPYSKDEFYDREFNEGVQKAREVLIERLNPKAILAALKAAKEAERDFGDILTSHHLLSTYWFKRAKEAEAKLVDRPEFVEEFLDEGLGEKLVNYLAPPLGSADQKFLAPGMVVDLDKFLTENGLKIVRIVDEDS